MSFTFKDFDLRDEVQRALDDAGYDTPTPIQEKALPILGTGSDLIGVAATGTGKTLAFLLPMFQQFRTGGSDPQGLVICPTRELAIQVAGEAERFGQHFGLRTVLSYGGTSSAGQKTALREGCDLVVGTPGRILDFVNSAWLSLRKVRFLVLDEADRMLDMGFINDVDAIIRRTPMSRQTALFSATFTDEVRSVADRYLLHPEIVRTHTGTRVTDQVRHVFYPVVQRQKEQLLLEILEREKPHKALIFTATREGTSELALALRRRRHEVVSLSSLLSQANRERAMDAFRSGETRLLVATDVAARGIDIDDIDMVINFDVPTQGEDYVHRVGRTGRAQREGRAVTLLSERDEERAAQIESLLGISIERVQLEDFPYEERRVVRRKGGRGRSSRSRGGGGRSGGGRSGGGRSGSSAPRGEGGGRGGSRSGRRRRGGAGRSGAGDGGSSSS